MHLSRSAIAAVVAVGALALAAGAHAVEVTDETTEEHCSEVDISNEHAPSGGCHTAGETELSGGQPTTVDIGVHTPGMRETVVSRCIYAFDMRLHATGDG